MYKIIIYAEDNIAPVEIEVLGNKEAVEGMIAAGFNIAVFDPADNLILDACGGRVVAGGFIPSELDRPLYLMP